MTKVTVEAAWAVLVEAVKANQPNGVIAIPSGDSGSTLNVDPAKIPASIAADIIFAGIHKPITDISKSKAGGLDSWPAVHAKRKERRDNFYAGTFANRGGVADHVGVQAKFELEQFLLDAGMKKGDLPKGRFNEMVDAIAKAKKMDETAKAAFESKFRAKAKETLEARNKAAASVSIADLDLNI